MKFERDTIDSAVRRTVGSGPRLSRSDHHHGLINRINPSKKDACACMCARVCACMRRARARARVPFCVAACLDCLRVYRCVSACLRPTTRLCLPIVRPFHLRGPIFLLARYSTPAPPSRLPSTTSLFPPPALVVTLSLPLPSTHLSLSPPVPAFSNPITLISYPVIRRLIDYSSTERKVCKRKYNSLRITRFH